MTPYAEGQDAAYNDLSTSSNPYPVESCEHADWLDGFEDAEAEFEAEARSYEKQLRDTRMTPYGER